MNTITVQQLEAFKSHLISQEKSAATVRKYLHCLTSLSEWLKAEPLTKDNLLIYRDKLKASRAPATVNGYLCAIDAFLAFTDHRELRVKSLKVQHLPFISDARELTAEEYARLLKAAQREHHIRLYHILLTLGATGIRVGELPAITVDAVNVGRAEINNKGKWRTILLPQSLCQHLRQYAALQNLVAGCLFVTRNGRPIDRSNLNHAMKKLCLSAEVDPQKVFPHNFRRLFARNFYKSTRHFPACSHNFPKAGDARFQGRSRLFCLLGKFPYLDESRRILMAVSSKTSSKTRFYYTATRRISSAAVQPSIWA